jgi:NADPH:quinone reductase-like Zn-dependent oxidoreductase
MRRVRFYACGGPEVLRLEEAPAPAAGPGELLVATEAIGVTLPAVRKVRGEGGAPGLPGVIGGEVAGEVVAAGPGVTGFRAGDRVTGLPFSGSYAELAVVAAPMASRIPDGRAPCRPSRSCAAVTSRWLRWLRWLRWTRWLRGPRRAGLRPGRS